LSSEIILGINPGSAGFGVHDPSAALIVDGRLVLAAEEERFVGTKGARGHFPKNAVNFCISAGNTTLDQITRVAISYSIGERTKRALYEINMLMGASSIVQNILTNTPESDRPKGDELIEDLERLVDGLNVARIGMQAWKEDAAKARLMQALPPTLLNKIEWIEHHRAHATSAYFLCGSSSAAALVIDGVGEYDTTTIWSGINGELEKLHSEPLPNSLGYFYAIVTRFLGFKPFEEEGKTMALAPYGCPNAAIHSALRRIINIEDERVDVTEFVAPVLAIGSGALQLDLLDEWLLEIFGRRRRDMTAPITQWHKDLAYEVQRFLEQATSIYARYAKKLTGADTLCLAGGVFLNCKLNRTLRESGTFLRTFVQPVAGDAGTAIGAALCASRSANRQSQLFSLALGYKEEIARVVAFLDRSRIPYTVPEDPYSLIAEAIANGKIVFFFEGRAEFGPRALGHRSILADPRDANMADRVNGVIKNRELWRPFAPSVLEERVSEVFLGPIDVSSAAFMVDSYIVSPKWREKIPAVVHAADKSSRIQAVSATNEAKYHALISAFEIKTGVPVLLNTSLNDKGMPIVNNAEDAIKFFFTCAADLLYLEGALVSKQI
jgi:carbamoyltransferase